MPAKLNMFYSSLCYAPCRNSPLGTSRRQGLPKQTDKRTDIQRSSLSFRWQNFRSLRDSQWVEIRPLTVFIGANSSGKTSLFLPLLLLKQTWTSRDPTIALKTTGTIVDLGNYRELVFRHRIAETVRLSFRFSVGSEPRPTNRPRGAPPTEPCFVSFQFAKGKGIHDTSLKKFEVRDRNYKLLAARSLTRSGGYSLRTSLALPKALKKIVLRGKPRHFFFPPFEQLLQQIEKARHGKIQFSFSLEKKKATKRKEPIDYLEMMLHVERQVIPMLGSVSYLGPLREYPQRFYETSEEVPQSVGTRGQKTPEILLLRKDFLFRSRLRDWLRKFGLAADIRCEPLGRGVFAVRIIGASPKSEFDYADTGFGLSQLLPLIVQGLHASRGSILCMEQPEIHLNPRLQSILANFFGALAKDKKTLIVETHSEHFLMRLRSLIAEKLLKPDDVALYFVEKEGDESSQRRIHIGPDGHIEPNEWPKGFFEESISESLRLASLQGPQG